MDDILEMTLYFLTRNVCILTMISLQFIPKGPRNNKLAPLVQVMAGALCKSIHFKYFPKERKTYWSNLSWI